MKYVKMFGLLAIAAVALIACSGIASADELTSSEGSTPTLKATSTNASLHGAFGTLTCSSSVEGKLEGHGAGKNLTGTLSKLAFTACVGGSVHNATIKGGTFSLNVTSTNHGVLSSSGMNLTLTAFGVECGYATQNTILGTAVGGQHGVLTISANLNRTHGSFFCGSTGNWTGSYTINSPTNIHLHNK